PTLGETSSPLPNTAVKLSSADGTAVFPWKTRCQELIIFWSGGKSGKEAGKKHNNGERRGNASR
uniref:hypothetical protein n=1 Tax=Syntrophomonas wolfei TaxID=863 RepID=UPI0023F281D6